MNVSRIVAAAGPDGSEGLLATVVRYDPGWHGRVGFMTDPHQHTQLGYLKHPAGHAVPPHTHPPAPRRYTDSEEVWVVLRGRVRADVYNSAGGLEGSAELGYGDSIILHAGGHALTVLEDAELVEVRRGPYAGRFHDKTALAVPPLPGARVTGNTAGVTVTDDPEA